MKKQLALCALLLSMTGVVSPRGLFAKKKAPVKQSHIKMSVTDYVKKHSKEMASNDKENLIRFLSNTGLMEGSGVREFESTFKVRHRVVIMSVDTREIKPNK